MKKPLVLSLTCIAVLGLGACSDDNDDSALRAEIERLTTANEALQEETVQLQEQADALQAKAESYISTFQQQCSEAGVKFDYVDPNAPTVNAYGQTILFADAAPRSNDCTSCHTAGGSAPDPHPDYGTCTTCHGSDYHDDTPPVDPGDPQSPTHPIDPNLPDALSGASGDPFYESSSYLNADYLATRLTGMYQYYEWAPAGEEETGVTTLADACQLENRQHIEATFPTDGEAYVLKGYSNQMGVKTVVTVNKVDKDTGAPLLEEQPNTAIFGYNLTKGTDGKYRTTMNIMGGNNTCYNAVMNGDVRFHYYEYEHRLSGKADRNKGARLLGTLDYTATSLSGLNYQPLPGFGAGENFDPADVPWDQVGMCTLVTEIHTIAPLG
ncbi:hypothetical protein KUV56_16980 [Ferrimonas balearica]|uniref:hypothetical protein n=1 Tax=Ferrimonas balearica TaxID=44012 RepID=UPI001C579E83|nr:hypothetical protein [Ferrimonas balearica]MBW3141193.1 hypothetical protein [Ferrimonas balearica]